jgi:hypothetical protein
MFPLELVSHVSYPASAVMKGKLSSKSFRTQVADVSKNPC